jgi:fumarate hydratase class II
VRAAFGIVLALGPHQVGIHRFRRFDHGQQSLDQSLMLVTALTPAIGYDRACLIAKHAHTHQLSLKEAALVLGEISAEEFDRWVKHESMLGP